jgi:hypothetical protein
VALRRLRASISKFGPLRSYPKPVNENVPIHVGGNSAAAARHAGRYGNGSFPTAANPEKFKELFAIVRSEAQKVGRNPEGYRIFLHEVRQSCGPEAVRVYGVSRVVITPPGTNPEVITRGLAKFQEKVISGS